MIGCLSCSFDIGSPAGIVTIELLVTPSLALCAHIPAKENGASPGRWICRGSFPPSD